MKKSGKTNREKPSDLSWVQNFLDCAQLFSEVGWLVLSTQMALLRSSANIPYVGTQKDTYGLKVA